MPIESSGSRPKKWPEVCTLAAHNRPLPAGDDPSSLRFTALLGEGDTVGFFDDTIPKEAAHARALLLAMLRDRRPGDEAYPPLVEAAGYYLRLNPDDAEMSEAWDGFVGRPPPAQKCAHNGFLLVEKAEESGCAVRCALCGVVGPVRDTPEAARKALLVLGAR